MIGETLALGLLTLVEMGPPAVIKNATPVNWVQENDTS